MSISNLFYGRGREIRYRSEFGTGHVGKGGLSMEASSHGLEPT